MWWLAQGQVLDEVGKYADRLGTVLLLLLLAYGGWRKWWVFGWVYREAQERELRAIEEKDAWRETALKASNVASDTFVELKRRA